MSRSFSHKYARTIRVKSKFARLFGGAGYPEKGVTKVSGRNKKFFNA